MLKLLLGLFGIVAVAGGVTTYVAQKNDVGMFAPSKESAFVSECISTASTLVNNIEQKDDLRVQRKAILPLLKTQIPGKCRCIDKALAADLPDREANAVRRLMALEFRTLVLQMTAQRDELQEIHDQAESEFSDIVIDAGLTFDEGEKLTKKIGASGRQCFR